MTGRTKRDSLKRKLAQSYNDMDTAILYLAEVYEEFLPVHPELVEGLEIASTLIINAQNIIETFSITCWNTDKESLLKFR